MICRDRARPMPEPFGFVVKNGMKILQAAWLHECMVA